MRDWKQYFIQLTTFLEEHEKELYQDESMRNLLNDTLELENFVKEITEID